MRYDGIYRIEKCWQIAGLQVDMRNFMLYFVCLFFQYMQLIWCHFHNQGFKVCRYLFVRCDNEPAPWTRYALFHSVAHLTLKRLLLSSLLLNFSTGNAVMIVEIGPDPYRSFVNWKRPPSHLKGLNLRLGILMCVIIEDFILLFHIFVFSFLFNHLYKIYFLKYKLEFWNIFSFNW